MRRSIEVPLLKGSVVRKKANRAKTVCIDVSFPDMSGPAPDAIIFQNFYTSYLTVSQQVRADEFVVILESYQLMKDAHCVAEAQNWHELSCSKFNSSYEPFQTLRFSLFQPDPTWQKFEICQIRAVSTKHLVATSPSAAAVEFNGSNVFAVISADWNFLQEASIQQRNLILPPEIGFTLTEYRKMLKRKEKEKKKEKKGSAGSIPVTNDEFGISIPDFSKNDDTV